MAALVDAVWKGVGLDPWARGRYPAAVAPLLEPVVRPGDLESFRAPLDWLGVNHYTRHRVAADPGQLIGVRWVAPPVGAPVTASGWEVAPEALAATLRRAGRALPGVPLYVTENGAAFDEAPGADGVVDDAARVRYLHDHVGAVARARAEGVDVRGYFAWTMWDDFEWADGYAHRFGLVHVDRTTLARTPKRSFAWYRRLVAEGRRPAP